MSQKTSITKTIDGTSYEHFMLSPRVSNSLLIKISKMIGPAFGSFIGGLTKMKGNKKEDEFMESEIDFSFFSQAASTLFSHLDEKTIDRLIDTLAENTHADGVELPTIFDIHFLGRLEVMYQWLAFCVEAQWGKSLAVCLKEIEKRQAAAAAVEAAKQAALAIKESPSPSI